MIVIVISFIYSKNDLRYTLLIRAQLDIVYPGNSPAEERLRSSIKDLPPMILWTNCSLHNLSAHMLAVAGVHRKCKRVGSLED